LTNLLEQSACIPLRDLADGDRCDVVMAMVSTTPVAWRSCCQGDIEAVDLIPLVQVTALPTVSITVIAGGEIARL
jgi:hypothetical protein